MLGAWRVGTKIFYDKFGIAQIYAAQWGRKIEYWSVTKGDWELLE